MGSCTVINYEKFHSYINWENAHTGKVVGTNYDKLYDYLAAK